MDREIVIYIYMYIVYIYNLYIYIYVYSCVYDVVLFFSRGRGGSFFVGEIVLHVCVSLKRI